MASKQPLDCVKRCDGGRRRVTPHQAQDCCEQDVKPMWAEIEYSVAIADVVGLQIFFAPWAFPCGCGCGFFDGDLVTLVTVTFCAQTGWSGLERHRALVLGTWRQVFAERRVRRRCAALQMSWERERGGRHDSRWGLGLSFSLSLIRIQIVW